MPAANTLAMKSLARLISALCLAIGLTALAGALPGGHQVQTGPEPVRTIPLTGPIGPASAAFITGAIEQYQNNSSALVIEMDTPGGLVDSMREINQAILGSDVPVIVYVSPSGARATSAGAYILYASHLAAMAPGTTVGAATPVEFGGAPSLPDQDPADPSSQPGESGEGAVPSQEGDAPSSDQAMRNKVVNDSVAAIRSLAELRGRNADWAERAVREGVSLTYDSALEEGVVEIVAASLDELLEQAEGRVVILDGGRETQIRVAGAAIEAIEPGLADRILSILTDPNIAFLLLNIGFIGLLASFYNGLEPVTLVAGLLCLILGFYGLNTLPVNYAGALLIVFGLGLLVAELFVTSYGVLAIAGLAVFALGSLMLIDTDVEGLRLDWRLVAVLTLGMGGAVIAVVGYGLAAQTRKVTTGSEGLKGATGDVLEWTGDEGFVHVEGDRWHAESSDALNPGDKIKVIKVKGLTLVVKKS